MTLVNIEETNSKYIKSSDNHNHTGQNVPERQSGVLLKVTEKISENLNSENE